MSSLPSLTLAFLERQPESAARVLEDLDPADAAAFLETVPVRVAEPAVCAMGPWAAARSVELLSPDQAAALVRSMDYPDAASVLRLIREERLDDILAALPSRLAKAFRNSLSYPKGTVGAWMDHSVPSFPAESSVADGLKYAKQRQNRLDGQILVVEEKGRFAGVVNVGDLLRSAAKTALAEIMDREVSPLSNRSMLTSVASESAWEEYSMLPVIGRRGNVLGGLTRKSLGRGLFEDRVAERNAGSGTLWAHLLAAFLLTCAGLLRFVSPPSRPGYDSTTEGKGRVR